MHMAQVPLPLKFANMAPAGSRTHRAPAQRPAHRPISVWRWVLFLALVAGVASSGHVPTTTTPPTAATPTPPPLTWYPEPKSPAPTKRTHSHRRENDSDEVYAISTDCCNNLGQRR